jgi:hypothetical protein
MAQPPVQEKIMNTLIHLSHQGTLLVQTFVATLAMLGLGLEGLPAEQQIQFMQEAKTPPA